MKVPSLNRDLSQILYAFKKINFNKLLKINSSLNILLSFRILENKLTKIYNSIKPHRQHSQKITPID